MKNILSANIRVSWIVAIFSVQLATLAVLHSFNQPVVQSGPTGQAMTSPPAIGMLASAR